MKRLKNLNISFVSEITHLATFNSSSKFLLLTTTKSNRVFLKLVTEKISLKMTWHRSENTSRNSAENVCRLPFDENRDNESRVVSYLNKRDVIQQYEFIKIFVRDNAGHFQFISSDRKRGGACPHNHRGRFRAASNYLPLFAGLFAEVCDLYRTTRNSSCTILTEKHRTPRLLSMIRAPMLRYTRVPRISR